jgi:hypothetical protein
MACRGGAFAGSVLWGGVRAVQEGCVEWVAVVAVDLGADGLRTEGREDPRRTPVS